MDSNTDELERALDAGSGTPLPPNHPQGILGETGPDLRRADDWTPDGSAGISQEADAPVALLAIILAYLLFFPLAYYLLWRTPALDRRRKWALGALMTLGVLAVGVALLR